MRVGDFVNCSGSKIVQRLIQWKRGGVYKNSHSAPIINDITNHILPRVMFLEALGSGGFCLTF